VDLSEQRLLDTLAGFATLDGLRGVQQKWDKALKRWRAAIDSKSLPHEVRNWAAETGSGALLVPLLPPEQMAEVQHRLPAEAQPPDPTVAWYTHLLQAAGGRETLLGRLAESEWSQRARQEGIAAARERERRRRAEEEERKRRQAEAQRALREKRRADEEARERRLREEQEAEQRRLREEQEEEQRLRRQLEWWAAEAARLRPAARALAVLRALALGFGWALVPVVAIWLTWWFSSYEFDAAQTLSVMAGSVGFASLYGLVPCAARLGSAFRPRLRMPWSWLPPARTALVVGTLLLFYGLIGGDSSGRSDDIKADSDLVRKEGWSTFLKFVGQNSYSPSGGDILLTLVVLPVFAGCLWAGWHAGRTRARRWEAHHAGARQEALRLTGLQ
jgi:hypothetical protein